MEKTPVVQIVEWIDGVIKDLMNKQSPNFNRQRALSFIVLKRKIIGDFLIKEKKFAEDLMLFAASCLDQDTFETLVDEMGGDTSQIDINDYYNWVEGEAQETMKKMYDEYPFAKIILDKHAEKMQKYEESKNKKETPIININK